METQEDMKDMMIQREAEWMEKRWKQKLKGHLLMILICERKAFTLFREKFTDTQRQMQTQKQTQR